MANRFPPFVRFAILAALALACSQAQPVNAYLSRMDRFAKTFTGAKAHVRSSNHVSGIPDDDVDEGTIFVKRSGAKTQFLIGFTTPNQYTVAVHDQVVEVYRPKLNEIQEYDLGAHKDIVQKLFLLGFGMAGSELAANYEIKDPKHETMDGQETTHLELIPKAPEVAKQLKRIEIWISDTTQCPVRQAFYLPDGSTRTAEFTAVEVNPKLPSNAFDLPKSAKRVRVN